jgi:hypothetical protein
MEIFLIGQVEESFAEIFSSVIKALSSTFLIRVQNDSNPKPAKTHSKMVERANQEGEEARETWRIIS